MSGEYHLTMDPSEKDALTYVPGAGLTEMESMGLASKTDRFNNTDGTHMAAPLGMTPETMQEFSRLDLYAKIQQAPPVKFKDLEAVVTSRLVRDQIKFQYRTDFLRITSDTVLVPITIQIPTRQLSFQEKNGVDSASVNLFGSSHQPERPHCEYFRGHCSSRRSRRSPAAISRALPSIKRRFRSRLVSIAWISC